LGQGIAGEFEVISSGWRKFKMRSIKKVLGYGMLAAAFMMIGSATGIAQSNCDDVDGYTALDAKIRENYAKLSTLQVAVDAGKQFLEKYGECEATKGMADYLKANLAGWEKKIKDAEEAEKTGKLYKRYDDGIKNSNFDDAYSAGREIIALKPNESLDQIIPLGAIGLYQSYNKNYKYNDETLKYAKLAIEKMKAGEKSVNGVYGVYNYGYKTKEDAMSEMNYAIGYILYYAKDDKMSALPYLYEVSQSPGRNKTAPQVYAAIGSFYVDKAQKVGNEIKPLVEELNNAATTNERKIELDKMIKAKEAFYKAYEERTLDALGRAYKVAKNGTPAEKEYRDKLYKSIQAIYESRFEKKEGLDSWLTTATAKPMPNPLSEVTPIAEEEAPTTTTTTSAAPAGGTNGTNGNTAKVAKP
jgi:hypothetical protein